VVRYPIYKDKNTDVEEYADYHDVDGLPTAFSITRVHNDKMQRQLYIEEVHYNQDLPADFWNIGEVSKRSRFQNAKWLTGASIAPVSVEVDYWT
jgi:hypothetical protein